MSEEWVGHDHTHTHSDNKSVSTNVCSPHSGMLKVHTVESDVVISNEMMQVDDVTPMNTTYL